MPKRTLEDKIERYHKKLRRLEQKQNSHRRFTRILESSESDAIENEDGEINDNQLTGASPPPVATTGTDQPETTLVLPESEIPSNTTLELNPDILSALGETGEDSPEFGEEIHNNLSQRWLPILRKGLSKETRDKILKDYSVPSNCTLLQAPKLNAEISAAITDMARNRDKKMEWTQQLLGVGVTAINRAMSLLVTSEEAQCANKITAIKMLGDGCRVLCDVHHSHTQARVKMVTPGLDKSFLNIIKDSERDNTLFGAKLSEKIKASRAIEKQGLQIKKTSVSQKSSTQAPQNRPRRQENWTGPSRYLTNRGGRGGQRRQAPVVRKAQPATTSRSSNPNKVRAATQD